ncbi:MAG: SRPBCC family protein [Bacteroidetes bacterium]|nr:SRPBCC family protein [Bacteroidota bacterium]
MKTKITVETVVNAPIEKVWRKWTAPEHIVNWCHASDDWHAPAAENDLCADGVFKTTMAAKDGSVSFDFEGRYTLVTPFEKISYILGDGRTVDIDFQKQEGAIKIKETFETEEMNSIELQRGGWQAILDNFKKYVEEK